MTSPNTSPLLSGTYPPKEAEAREAANIKRMLATPPTPHEAMRKGRESSRKN